MQQDLVVVIALGAHYCGTNLAESYAVSPACTRESECLRHAVLYVLLVNHECAAVEMRIAQRAAYLQFLSDGECALRAHNLQSADASAAATLHWNEVENVAELHLQTLCDEALQLLLRVCDVPAIEVGRLLVVVVEHFREYLLVVGVAERLRRRANPAFGVLLYGQVGQFCGCGVAASARACISHVAYRRKIRFLHVLPAILELLRRTAAALAEARVAYLVVVHQYLSACGVYSLRHMLARSLCDALIALAVVVGAYVEDGVVFAVVPLYQLVVLAYEREEAAASGARLLLVALFNLRKQPAARDDGVRLEQFEARCGAHLA